MRVKGYSICKCQKCGKSFRSGYYNPAKTCPDCRHKKNPLWTHWYVVLWVNPDSQMKDQYFVGQFVGSHEPIHDLQYGAMTLDGNDFCIGVKFSKKLCKLPRDYEKTHKDSTTSILETKRKKLLSQEDGGSL